MTDRAPWVQPGNWSDQFGGITKRELFAAMAMQAILTGAVTRACPSNEWFEMDTAVRCADSLLTALKETP